MGYDVGILLDPSFCPVIAHRGASGSCPENTILALDRALQDGADALEFDVRMSADGVPVVIHDPTVDRTTDGVGRVRALTVADLERLDAGRGERVPRLDAVMERFADAVMLIEIKDPAASTAVLGLFRRHGAERRVLVGSFRWRALLPFVRAGIATTAARVGVAAALLASRFGVAWPTNAVAYVVPERRSVVQVVDERFVRAARSAGRPVHVWTVNDPDNARRLRNLGVSGIITDYPGQLRNL